MKIIGVTACIAGIAHTYMAQAAIEKEAKKQGHECKIETQGSMGNENELEEHEIEAADVVIIGADINVEGIERFDDKVVYKTTVSECVSEPEKVIAEAIKLIG
ncbi:fructose-specific phosphotransferase system IIB component [Breznakia sp. PF5-3]|uniref:PTS fructose transporter subunit IIB n=1 Tax=unclassified Breznakia TaxID=2623764 RepID=UPI0024058C53|nr:MULTISPECIES: fructose PTS transporter subunit IIB [unclassified Breznakia]MDF9825422.1 fructose-specific phosphotransferase system IIB component [Breznakia sp. PM6-1]MDF9836300.1 fructose-specific phosphotransferase system IIB component [Breznakia sp. PF5-3]MDF9838928.1 fructose-specific phosphotransferase system IIB component [Breznakia sp. PFB2-8]MDF9860954.1 fructose-specific phosphotransferase system IIB component [Breznakia sp. PH5-24]